jgi:general stress protein YciG
MGKSKRKNPAAVELGSLGGKARAKALTREEMSEIARKAGKARKTKLPPAQRKRIARQAAQARWAKQSKPTKRKL